MQTDGLWLNEIAARRSGIKFVRHSQFFFGYVGEPQTVCEIAITSADSILACREVSVKRCPARTLSRASAMRRRLDSPIWLHFGLFRWRAQDQGSDPITWLSRLPTTRSLGVHAERGRRGAPIDGPVISLEADRHTPQLRWALDPTSEFQLHHCRFRLGYFGPKTGLSAWQHQS